MKAPSTALLVPLAITQTRQAPKMIVTNAQSAVFNQAKDLFLVTSASLANILMYRGPNFVRSANLGPTSTQREPLDAEHALQAPSRVARGQLPV